MEPKRLHPGAVLENGATLEGGAVFSRNNHVSAIPPPAVRSCPMLCAYWCRAIGQHVICLGGSQLGAPVGNALV